MRQLLKYPGSKFRTAEWIISHFPEHHSYLEPFFGSGGVFFNKPPSRIETINDLDNNVVNLFEVIRDYPEELAEAVFNIPYARAVFDCAFLQIPQGKIDKVVIGADRIAKGGVVNKVGSFMVALAAKHHDIPFYVAAPYSTFDNEISIYDTIIEERDGDEVRYYGGARICPEGTEVINPAFDITPKDLITGIITEKGIIDPI